MYNVDRQKIILKELMKIRKTCYICKKKGQCIYFCDNNEHNVKISNLVLLCNLCNSQFKPVKEEKEQIGGYLSSAKELRPKKKGMFEPSKDSIISQLAKEQGWEIFGEEPVAIIDERTRKVRGFISKT